MQSIKTIYVKTRALIPYMLKPEHFEWKGRIDLRLERNGSHEENVLQRHNFLKRIKFSVGLKTFGTHCAVM